MKTANKRQRERLLELIRRLAEDDKSGVMAHKVLKLFWTLAHSIEIPKEARVPTHGHYDDSMQRGGEGDGRNLG